MARPGAGTGGCANFRSNFPRTSCTLLTLRPCILQSSPLSSSEAAEMFIRR
jgi:hypothetical protein